MKRVLTALVLIPVALAAVLLAPQPLFVLLLLALALLTQRELFSLFAHYQLHPARWIGGMVTALAVLSVGLDWPLTLSSRWQLNLPPLSLLLIAGALALLVRMLSAADRLPQALPEAGANALALFYPGLLLGLLAAIRLFPAGREWILYLFVVVWSGDSFAYYAGRQWGRHKLAPRISPGKSWEGALASLLGAMLCGALIALLLPALYTGLDGVVYAGPLGRMLRAALLAIPLNLMAQAGDLAESVLKRGAGVKDSGTLLPGHGGLLDRLDALLLATPLLWYYLSFR